MYVTVYYLYDSLVAFSGVSMTKARSVRDEKMNITLRGFFVLFC